MALVFAASLFVSGAVLGLASLRAARKTPSGERAGQRMVGIMSAISVILIFTGIAMFASAY